MLHDGLKPQVGQQAPNPPLRPFVESGLILFKAGSGLEIGQQIYCLTSWLMSYRMIGRCIGCTKLCSIRWS